MISTFLRAQGEMAQRISAFPWSEHPLGPLEAWPQSLRTSLSLILNSRHPMWIGWGERLWFLYNDAYLHVLGLAKHPWALGRPAAEVWAEIWDVCGPLADNVLARGEPSFVDDVRLFLSRGDALEETFYSFSYSPIHGEAGNVAGLFCASNDVTAKVVGARRLRTLSELAADALAEKSAAAACASAAATLAKNPDDVPFALLYLVDGERCVLRQRVGIASDVGALAPEALAALTRSGPSQRIGLPPLDPPPRGSAERTVTDAVVLPVAGRAASLPLGVLITGRNPTAAYDPEYQAFFELVASNIGTAVQNARAAEQEKVRLEMLAEMDRAKTAFFSNVSHEFRTPLTLMLGPLERLSHGTGEVRTLAQTARRNALRLLKLVNTLLEFSRLEAGRDDAVFAPTDAAALTRDVASSFRSAIEGSGLRFTVTTELDEPLFIDRSMWERILLNLLSNALKFTFSGEIAVALRRVGDAAELSVRDTGVGVAAADLPQLFERFHRVRGAASRSHEGSGIGLALVRDLAHLHGGGVAVESAAGRGSTFRVRIPLGSAHLDPAKVSAEPVPYTSSVEQYLAEMEATMAQLPSAVAPPAAETGRARVLLADDNADLRAYVAGILAPRYAVTAVRNGREALDAARASRFDLIISDVMMPEMDGFELLRALRGDDRLADIPFLMLSARAGEESSREGLLAGADDYIVKPFLAEHLLARVSAQINAAAIRERAVQRLRESEERFRTLAASLPFIVVEADSRGAVTFLSDEFAAYTGRPVEAGYGARWRDVVHPDDLRSIDARWTEAVRAASPFAGELRLRRSDGAHRWFVARVLPQRAADGAVLRWTGTIADVHEQRKAAQERDFLFRASGILAQPLALDATLAAIASFIVPDVADWSQIDLLADDGRLRTVAIAHRDSEKLRLAQQLVGEPHLNPDAGEGPPAVARTARTQLWVQLPPEVIASTVSSDEEFRIYAELGIGSALCVPLVAEGRTLGVLSVAYGDSQRRYSGDDVPMFEELGRRAGLAIHRARLFEREHRAAESFQHASLPAALPHVPGLTLDAYYAPGRAEALVGGDWYDALRLLDGRVVISIGDVAGSGLAAAVTMGNMRQIIRGIAQVHADPALMLDAADRALRLEHPDTYVTAFVAVFDPIGNLLTYASAGHPPPLLRWPDGTIAALAERGLPLGLRVNGVGSGSTTIEMPAGASLVLYTDGLTEFDRDAERAERRLRGILSGRLLTESMRPAKALVDEMLRDGDASDDVAVLVATLSPLPQQTTGGDETLQRWTYHTDEMYTFGNLRRSFATAFAAHGGDADDVATAELVLGELISNTVRYAPGPVEVVVDWSRPEPVLHVLDEGPGFRHIAILPPDVYSESGRGLFLVAILTGDFRVSKRPHGGSHARAVLRLRKRQLADADGEALSGSLLHAMTGVGVVSE